MIFFILKYLVHLMHIAILVLVVSAIAYGGQANDIPLSARMVLFKAQKLMGENKFTEAAEALEKFQEKSRKLKPGEPDSKGYRHYLVDFTLGNCCLMTKNYSEADTHFRAAVAAKPDFNSGWMNLAKCCYDMNAHARAGHAFLKGYETAPEKDSETLYYGAVCFMTAGDSQKALRLFQRLLKEHPAGIKLEWKEAFAQAYLACDQPLKALSFIEELSEKTEGKKRKQWQEIRLHLYMSLDMKTKALEYAKRLIREYPLESNWWKGLANLYLKENRYRPALVALNIYGYLAPLSKQEKKLVADLNMTIGIPIQSTRLYEEILAERPDTGIVKRVVQSYMRRHMPGDALKWVEKGLLHASDADLWMLKGNLLYEMEMYEEAMNAFETAAGIMSRPGQAWLMMGYAAWKEGFVEISLQAFKRALNYRGQKNAARSALCQLSKSESL